MITCAIGEDKLRPITKPYDEKDRITLETKFLEVAQHHEILKSEETHNPSNTSSDVYSRVDQPANYLLKSQTLGIFGITIQSNQILSIYAEAGTHARVATPIHPYGTENSPRIGSSLNEVTEFMETQDIGEHEPLVISHHHYFRVCYYRHQDEMAFEFNLKKKLERIIIGNILLPKPTISIEPDTEKAKTTKKSEQIATYKEEREQLQDDLEVLLQQADDAEKEPKPVSYTHLTLPTIYSV